LKINEFREYCLEHKYPILQLEAVQFLVDYIKKNDVKQILEIGSAVGYSAINFSLANHAKVLTLEKDPLRAEKAVEFIKVFNANVEVVNVDALEYQVSDELKFDLIFIDAAKGQYEKFFTKYQSYLNSAGVIVCDNLNFHHLNFEQVSKQTQKLLIKINKFKQFLINHPDFETKFFEIGDGLSLSTRKIR
jgi:predicted O-methyltransferase YrrM